MPTPNQKARIGGFVIVGIVLFTAVLVATVGFTTEQQTRHYLVFQESVNGLSEGSAVKYRGLPVGKVTRLYFDPGANGIVAEILVRDAVVSLPEGCKATLGRSSLVGAVDILIEGGDPSRLLEAGEVIPTVASLSMQIENSLPFIIADIRDAMARINQSLQQIQPEQVEQLVNRTNELAEEVRAAVATIRVELNTTLTKIDGAAVAVTTAADTVTRAADGFDETVAGLEEPVQLAIQDLRGAVRDLDAATLAANLNDTLRRVNRLIPGLDATIRHLDLEIRGLLVDASDTLSSARLLFETLDREPSSLIFGRAPDEDAR